MRTVLTSLIAILALVTPALANDPYPFQRSDGKWGYVDDEHCWVIEPQFETAYAFSSGNIAPVRSGGKFGFIKKDGAYSIAPYFEDVHLAADGFAYSINGGWGLLSSDGHVIVNPVFEEVRGFREGLAPHSPSKSLISLS